MIGARETVSVRVALRLLPEYGQSVNDYARNAAAYQPFSLGVIEVTR